MCVVFKSTRKKKGEHPEETQIFENLQDHTADVML